MVNEIVDAIAAQTGAAFGDGFTIYTDRIGQDAQKPCFYIALLQSSRSPRPNGGFLERSSFDVRCYPADADGARKLYDTAEKLYGALEVIALADGCKARGTDRRYEIRDGALHFFVTYGICLARRPELPVMETLDVDAGTKEG